mmetsp:Transcript_12185/g.40462  ORF Transcript_12185/g.40462 Transcript_12185/m.40462 type:complete len:467 (+) Transcript_12185:468-1868(+)
MPRAVNEHEAGETNSATGVGGAVIFEGECVVRGTGLVGVAVGEAVGVSETNATKGMGGGRAALPVSISKRESVSPPAPFASFARAATRALRLCFVVTLPEGPVPNNSSVSDAVRYPTSLPDADMSVVATSEIPPPARRSSFLLRRLFLTTAESKFSIMPDCTGTTGSSLTRERGFTTTGVFFADSGDCFLGVGIVNPSRKSDTGAVAGRGGNFFVDVVFFSTASSVGRAGSTGVAPAPFALSPRKSSPRRGRLSDFAEAAEAVCASNSACSFAAAASRSESRFTRSSSNRLDVSSSSASIISSTPVSFSETPDAPLSVLSPLRFVRAFAFLALFRAPRCASRRSVFAAVRQSPGVTFSAQVPLPRTARQGTAPKSAVQAKTRARLPGFRPRSSWAGLGWCAGRNKCLRWPHEGTRKELQFPSRFAFCRRIFRRKHPRRLLTWTPPVCISETIDRFLVVPHELMFFP